MLATARLTLRPLRADDLAALHAIYASPEAMRWWSRPPHDTLAETEALLERLIRAESTLGPELAIERQGRLIGRIGIWRQWEFGYILHPGHWGLGLASEAVRAFLPAAFARHPACTAITAEIDPANHASARVLEKAGFRITGTQSKTFFINGTWSDSTYYRLPRPARPSR